ncbi:hypothetical protein [Mycobacterium attenuatum]|uniref:channel accessory protein ArfC, sunset domain variant n=1 Tax=Mycobacterium attenuatum TaxID=2341086 RepID=UPI000F025846|nr:hypothetical protein [Mycobacterium attenuatum]VBA61266.1 putative membrane protein ArfC [Mycobacterium attenuatum]
MTGHLHWWLVGLSFALGLLLTFMMMVGPVKSQQPQHKPRTLPRQQATQATVAGTRPKKSGAGKGAPATKVPAAKKVPRSDTADAEKTATQEITAGKVPAAPPVGESSAEQTAVTREAAPQTPTRFAPYGPGSARADADGSGPPGWLVKGRTDTRLYYTPEDPDYDATAAQVWFQDEGAAARAFFTPWRKSARRE